MISKRERAAIVIAANVLRQEAGSAEGYRTLLQAFGDPMEVWHTVDCLEALVKITDNNEEQKLLEQVG